MIEILKNNSELRDLLANSAGARGVLDFLGLGGVITIIQELGMSGFNALAGVVGQIIDHGTGLLETAKPVLADLISDLTNHVGDAGSIFNNALAALNAILAGDNRELRALLKSSPGARGVLDFLGLGGVITIIQELGMSGFNALAGVVGQIIDHGTGLLETAKPVLADLLSDLTNHVGDAGSIFNNALAALNAILAGDNRELGALLRQSAGARGVLDFLGLGGVITIIQELGMSGFNALAGVVGQIIDHGTGLLETAKPVLADLLSDLTNHVGDAGSIFNNALAALNAILAGDSRV